MNQSAQAQQTSRPDPQQELLDLIAAASKQPGIEQLMRVYQQWRPFDAAMQAHRQYFGVHRLKVASNSSGEHIFHPK